MQLFSWATDPELLSSQYDNDHCNKQLESSSPERSSSYAPFDEERLDVKMGRNFEAFMNFICFPEEQMDYICFPQDENYFINRNVDCVVEKEHQEERLGISIQKHVDATGIFVSKIDPAGKFAATDLKPGMKIVSINDEECPPTIPETIAVLRLANGLVKMVAEESPQKETEPDDSPVTARDDAPRDGSPPAATERQKSQSFVSFTDLLCGSDDTLTTACGQYEETITSNIDIVMDTITGGLPTEQIIQIHKDSENEKLGIALMQSKTCNDIYVNHVWEGTKFAAAGLEPGLKLLRINGTVCPETLDETVAAMNGAVGDLQLTVVASDQFCHELEETMLWNGVPIVNKVVARIEKSRDEPIGMLLRKYPEKDGIFISKIGKDGKAASTQLKPHMKVLLINDQVCPQEMEDCTQLITEVDGKLKLVAVAYIPQELLDPAEV